MTVLALTKLISLAVWWEKTINYKIIKGNAIWRFAIVLLVVLIAIAIGRILQYVITAYAQRREDKQGVTALTLFLKCLTKPISVAFFAFGLYFSKLCLIFEDRTVAPPIEGISATIEKGWTEIAQAVAAIAAAYALYKLVDVAEHYLLKWTSRTTTKLDDMLVPVIRKSLRITIAVIAALWIAEGILGAQIRTILLSAGVGGIAIALAAKDTVANFFGSITIFADRPFQVDDLVKIGEHFGPVEEVGFRSTRVRTLEGHLVSIPNSMIVNSTVENVGKRPFIRRTSNITITYDSGHTKAKRAVDIIKEILADVPEVNKDPDKPPRIYFNEFNDCSLNIYMSYWVKPADYWLYYEVNERVNLELMKRFESEQIEFAFPTQTLYVKKE
ncbi:MAG: mechanosensitive ion channel family protein [Sedimentisphaerales bacterium]|nr:mechanosensitive ion channel family protein [Sedimentisphaerales bacterium]